MDFAVARTRALAGIESPPVDVEVHLTGGLPKMTIVGLAGTSVKESRERVRSALMNAGFEFPSDKAISINLTPAELPKTGGRFDLAIAVAILAATGSVPDRALERLEFVGELGFGGDVRPIPGALPAVLGATASGHVSIVPEANRNEVAVLGQATGHLGAATLMDVVEHLRGHLSLAPIEPRSTQTRPGQPHPCLADIEGQGFAKRALTIAAAGAHNLLMVGPPGTGKSMLASRLPRLLPPMTDAEALEVASVHSVSRLGYQAEHWRMRPFRAPHHSATPAALAGGGSPPFPGEVALAHHGVLFLDELPEFSRTALEILREPLESRTMVLSRARHRTSYPAAFTLVAAMNPCPCGYYPDPRRCECSGARLLAYRARISGPLLDRIDLHVEVPQLPVEQLERVVTHGPATSTDNPEVQVGRARERALARCGKPNAHLSSAEVRRNCAPDQAGLDLMRRASERLGLSARSYFKVLKVARTIADLDESDGVCAGHIAEAIGYRRLDRV